MSTPSPPRRWLSIGPKPISAATTSTSRKPPPMRTTRRTTGPPPSPRARRPEIALASSCSSGRKIPGATTKRSAQKLANAE